MNIILLLLALYLSQNLGAEEIIIPLNQQGEQTPRPTLGQTKAQVSTAFGLPIRTQTDVGQPPISRWHYKKFTVYFEGNTVIHSVLKHKSKS